MNRAEVIDLLEWIDLVYPNRVKIEDREGRRIRFETWAELLSEEDADVIKANCKAHMKNSPHPPNISDLVTSKAKSNVPDLNETAYYLQMLETHRPIRNEQTGVIIGYEPKKPLTEEDLKEIKGYQDEIKRILGIGGGDIV